MSDTGLSIYESSITNKDVMVTFTPASDVVTYSYTIIKDNEVGNLVSVDKNILSNFKFDSTGNYQIEITTFNGLTYNKITSGVYKIDKEAPILNISEKSVNVKVGENVDVLECVTATDNIDGEITSKVTSNIDEIDLTKVHSDKLTYQVVDSAGNIATNTVNLNIIKNNNIGLSINQVLVGLVLIGILIIMLLYDRSIKLEKRLARYTIRPVKDNNTSLFSTFSFGTNLIINRITKLVSKSEVLNKQSEKYEKYIIAFGKKGDKAITFVSKKILISFIFLIIAFISQTLRGKMISVYEMVLLLLVGYYALDLIYMYKYHEYRKQIEKDLLQAIIIMNNAFKSGRSITQAIDLVGNELTGAISEEFKKMALEISYGLDIEVVFKRFSERIKIEEAAYLTSSLSILNRTGGNIIQVFTSIEKTLFNRQKLKIELKSLTGSAKLIMWVLTLTPLCFVILISIINPNYFAPLLTNVLGIIIIGVIIVLYVLYIIIVRKIMKIRM